MFQPGYQPGSFSQNGCEGGKQARRRCIMAQSPNRPEPAAAAYSKGPAIMIAAIAALGGLLFGYDTGVISGAGLFFTKDFHLSREGEELRATAVQIEAFERAAVTCQLPNALG